MRLLHCLTTIVDPRRPQGLLHPLEPLLFVSVLAVLAGANDQLLAPHPLLLALGGSVDERQAAYRALFEAHFDEKTLEEVSASINQAWVLGSEHFRNIIAAQLNHRASPLPKGGDRKSGQYGKSCQSNRICPYR